LIHIKIQKIKIVMKKMFLTAAFIVANGMLAYCGSMKLVNEQVIDLEDVAAIEILYFAEDVTLLTSNTSSLVIKEYMSEDKTDYYAGITKSGSKLTVKRGIRPSLRTLLSFRASVEVYIPALNGKSLRIETTSGKIDAGGEYVCGQLAIESMSGRVFVNRITADTVSIRTTSGAIMCRHVKGNADIQTMNGGILLDRTDGSLSVKATSGRIEAGMVAGSLIANSQNGDVRCDVAGESANITTTSGAIQCGEVKGNGDVRTTNGDIWLSKVGGNVSASTASGYIGVEQVVGSLIANSQNGDVRCDVVGESANITTTSGAIQCGEVKGNGDVRTTNGRIWLGKVGGNVSANTTNGRVRVEQVAGSLAVKSLSGGVHCDAAGGSIAITTTSGAIQAATAKNVECISLASTSGRINLEIPRSSSFNFSARTVNGKLSAPFSEKLTRSFSEKELIQGVVGEAGSGGSIDIRTTSGAINIGW
jgi:DUF4097 and DUF4098 domain-containing protein YvlB